VRGVLNFELRARGANRDLHSGNWGGLLSDPAIHASGGRRRTQLGTGAKPGDGVTTANVRARSIFPSSSNCAGVTPSTPVGVSSHAARSAGVLCRACARLRTSWTAKRRCRCASVIRSPCHQLYIALRLIPSSGWIRVFGSPVASSIHCRAATDGEGCSVIARPSGAFADSLIGEGLVVG
jgi:hypothetical protein